MSTAKIQERFAAAADALFEGDSEKASALMAEAAAAAAPQVDIYAIADAVERRAATTNAARQMLADHPGLAKDPDMVLLADRAADLKVRGGMKADAAIMEACSEIAQKYNLEGANKEPARRARSASPATQDAEDDPQAAVAREGLAFLLKSRHGNSSI